MSELIELELKNWLDSQRFEKKIYNAIEYSIFPGGSRFRPRLCLLTCNLLNGSEKKVLPFAVSIELVHTFSLIHDDLPCMDNSDVRRRKPSLHKKFDSATALLVGDLLLTEAISVANSNYDRNIVGLILECVRDMILGQSMDLNPNNNLEQIFKLKTGKLIESSVVGTSKILGNDELDIELKEFSKDLGFAYQIADDIKDFDKNPTDNNYVKKYGLDFARKKLETLLTSAKNSLSNFSNKQKMIAMIEKHFSQNL